MIWRKSTLPAPQLEFLLSQETLVLASRNLLNFLTKEDFFVILWLNKLFADKLIDTFINNQLMHHKIDSKKRKVLWLKKSSLCHFKYLKLPSLHSLENSSNKLIDLDVWRTNFFQGQVH